MEWKINEDQKGKFNQGISMKMYTKTAISELI